uniref:Uncharacterized protein n=1 Tax=Oryza nivara TaxID=4536 RepID=A0A0E0HBJ1_ORYNI
MPPSASSFFLPIIIILVVVRGRRENTWKGEAASAGERGGGEEAAADPRDLYYIPGISLSLFTSMPHGLGHSAHPMRCGPRLVVGYPDTVYPTKTERGGVGDGAGLGALGIGVDGGDVGCSGDEQRRGGRAREQVHEVREVEVHVCISSPQRTSGVTTVAEYWAVVGNELRAGGALEGEGKRINHDYFCFCYRSKNVINQGIDSLAVTEVIAAELFGFNSPLIYLYDPYSVQEGEVKRINPDCFRFRYCCDNVINQGIDSLAVTEVIAVELPLLK